MCGYCYVQQQHWLRNRWTWKRISLKLSWIVHLCRAV
jgi:hypothetical protein